MDGSQERVGRDADMADSRDRTSSFSAEYTQFWECLVTSDGPL